MQAAARHVAAAADPASSSGFCLVVAASGALGGSAALWQIVEAASRNTPAAPAVSAALLLDCSEALLRRHEGLAQLSVHWHAYTERNSEGVSFADFLHKAAAGSQHLAASTAQSAPERAPQPAMLVVDSLDTALAYHSQLAVCEAIGSFRSEARAPRILAAVHADVQSATTIAALRQLASCTLMLSPASATQAEAVQAASGHTVHVEATALTLRHSGAVPACNVGQRAT